MQVITPAHLAHSSAQLVTASTAASFQLWLQQHSRLLHTLDLGPGLEEEHAAATAAACAEGLALARQGLANAASAAADAAITAAEATGLPGLLLQGFRGPWEETILQQLPAATLTYLSITGEHAVVVLRAVQKSRLWCSLHVNMHCCLLTAVHSYTNSSDAYTGKLSYICSTDAYTHQSALQLSVLDCFWMQIPANMLRRWRRPMGPPGLQR